MWLETTPGKENIIAGGVVAGIIAAEKIFNHFKGKRRDRTRTDESSTTTKAVDRLTQTIDRRFDKMDSRVNDIEATVAEVRAFCVGPDGKNGFRKDIGELKEGLGREIGEIKEKVGGLEDRERLALAERALHAVPDRRVAS